MDTIPDTPGEQYISLIRECRALSHERSDRREEWFASLENEEKEEILFELEMLLKGLVCFGDPRNHPGPRQRGPVETRTYHQEVQVVHAACERIVNICHQLLSSDDVTQDEGELMPAASIAHVSTLLLKESLSQDLPEQSLRLLHRAFSDLADVSGVLARLDPVPYRGFVGLTNLGGREIGRNAFFDPLRTLEFSPEYDHLRQVELLDIVSRDGPRGAQKAIALSFLALQRQLRYLDVALDLIGDRTEGQLVWIFLAAFRVDGSALANFMRKDAPLWMAGGFEEQVLNLKASEILEVLPMLEQEYLLLHDLGAIFQSMGDQLGLEIRNAFEHALDFSRDDVTSDEARQRVSLVLAALREFIKSSILILAQVFEPAIEATHLFRDGLEGRALSERLRRDIWIFNQVMRAFLAKAEAAPESANKWSGTSSYRFVRDFIVYFKNLGFHLLRASSYERIDELMTLIQALNASDMLEHELVEVFVRECEFFRDDLQHTFDAVSQSEELRGVPFDRHGAAETLRMFLERG